MAKKDERRKTGGADPGGVTDHVRLEDQRSGAGDDENSEGTARQPFNQGRSDRTQRMVQGAVSKNAEGPRELRGAAFGQDHRGYAYRAILGPIVKSCCEEAGCKDRPQDMPVVRQHLEDWQPSDPRDVLMKRLLLVAIDDFADWMVSVGSESIDNQTLAAPPQSAPQFAGRV